MVDMNETKILVTISVVIPAYNAKKHILLAIQIILTQGYPTHKIIVIDDGSIYNSEEVIKWYNQKVEYIYRNNGLGQYLTNNYEYCIEKQ